MQDYTPLGSTATTTVKDGILNHEKNINALRSTYSGAAFPTENLVAGLKCYRTDLGKTYTYNGKTWDDSVNTSSLTVSGETSVPTPATANNSKTIANTEFVHGVVSDLVNGAPTALDTLQELAAALGNDPNFATTILNKIGEKESKTDAQIEHKKLQNAIPTKVSQLSNDSGYQKTAEIPVVSQTQNGYMSKDDKVKLDGIAEGATNVTDYVQSATESNGKVTVTKGGGETTTFNAGLNILVRNKAYSVGDIAYSPDLPSYLYLECTTAGTTGETEPDMSALSGEIVNDGTAQFSVKTVCAKEYVDTVTTPTVVPLTLNPTYIKGLREEKPIYIKVGRIVQVVLHGFLLQNIPTAYKYYTIANNLPLPIIETTALWLIDGKHTDAGIRIRDDGTLVLDIRSTLPGDSLIHSVTLTYISKK